MFLILAQRYNTAFLEDESTNSMTMFASDFWADGFKGNAATTFRCSSLTVSLLLYSDSFIS
jgi:hypothetical protein